MRSLIWPHACVSSAIQLAAQSLAHSLLLEAELALGVLYLSRQAQSTQPAALPRWPAWSEKVLARVWV